MEKKKIRLSPDQRAAFILAPVDLTATYNNVVVALKEQDRLRERLDHALAALRHIARTCIEDPDAAQFASYASSNPPAAFAPKEDYEKEKP